MSGEEFGPYRLLARLGAGGMGEVWRARDSRTDREVAIKRLHPSLAGDPSFVAGFRREAALAAKLNHPAIVPIHSYGEIDDQLYIEMPLLAGTDLAALIARDGPLAPARAVEVIAQVAEALDTAHAAGLVHRDVKPSNVMVQARRRGDFVHLIDFGIARQAGSATTSSVGLVGTLTYMAPERFDGPADLRSDVYALAGVLYYALTGQKPFAPPPDTDPDLLFYVNAHLNQPPPRASDHAPAAARAGLAGLDAVIARGMAKRPDDRYPSAGELATAAHAALEAKPDDGPAQFPTVPTPRRVVGPISPPNRAPSAVPRGAPVADRAAPVADRPAPVAGRAAPVADRAAGRAAPIADRAADRATPVADRGTDRATPVAGRATPVAAPASTPPTDALPAARGPRPSAAPPPFPGERYPQPVEPPAAPPSDPPASGAARRRRIGLGIGAVLLALALTAAGLIWANLPTTGTAPVGPTGTAAAPASIERTLTGHTNWVFGLATAQLDGRTVVISSSADNSIRLWDLATGAPVGSPFTGHTGPVAAVTTAQLDGRTVVVSGSADATVRVWDLATGKQVGSPFVGHTTAVAALATAQLDGRPVAVSGSNDATVRVWDLATGKQVGAPFTGHTGFVQAVATAQLNGRTVVISGGADNALRVWDLATRAPVGTPYTGHTQRVVGVTTAQLGGRTLAISGAWDNTVQVWDLATGARVGAPFTGHTDFVCVVATAQLGERTVVISGGRDTTVRLWDLDVRARQ